MQAVLIFSGILALIAVFLKAGERLYYKRQREAGIVKETESQTLLRRMDEIERKFNRLMQRQGVKA